MNLDLFLSEKSVNANWIYLMHQYQDSIHILLYSFLKRIYIPQRPWGPLVSSSSPQNLHLSVSETSIFNRCFFRCPVRKPLGRCNWFLLRSRNLLKTWKTRYISTPNSHMMELRHISIVEHLNEVHQNIGMVKGGPHDWPVRFPDFTHSDNFLWGHLKN